MENYIGTKRVKATPMSRIAYTIYRNWSLPDDENGEDKGYLIEYLDGGEANHPDHKGYISWSPKKVFEDAYSLSNELTFGEAIEAMKLGAKVARAGWNGKGMWIKLVKGSVISSKDVKNQDFTNPAGDLEICSHIDMFSADKKQVVGWLASQTDMLADDWQIV